MDMQTFEATFPANVADAETRETLGKDIGRTFRYVLPTDPTHRMMFVRTHGMIVVGSTFRVIGVQKDWKGRPCYRAQCITEHDSFGRCVNPAETKLEFLD